MHYANKVTPEPEQLEEFFAGPEDGPFVMVNLLKFKPKAEYPDGSEPDLSGRDAYLRYGAAVQSCLEQVGGRSLYFGSVTGLLLGEAEELWDMVALAEYPSLEAFQSMVTSAEYQAISVHRTAGLAGQLNIKTKAMTP